MKKASYTPGGVCLLRCDVSAAHEPAQIATVLGRYAELATEQDQLTGQNAAWGGACGSAERRIESRGPVFRGPEFPARSFRNDAALSRCHGFEHWWRRRRRRRCDRSSRSGGSLVGHIVRPDLYGST